MTTKQIDYCIELAHTLNFSKAAENCFASQPTFSYQMNLLENEVALKYSTEPVRVPHLLLPENSSYLTLPICVKK